MTHCEFRFERVFVLGSDEYLDVLAAWFDALFTHGWVLDDAMRSPARDGWWLLSFFRDAHSRSALINSRW